MRLALSSASLNQALIDFRETSEMLPATRGRRSKRSRLRGPTLERFAQRAGLRGKSSAQQRFARLVEVGWIVRREDAEARQPAYVLTPAGERRYRELVPLEERVGPEWPTA